MFSPLTSAFGHLLTGGAMQKQKDTAVAGLTKGIEGLLKKNKVCFEGSLGNRI